MIDNPTPVPAGADRARLSVGSNPPEIHRPVAEALATRHPGGGTLMDTGCGHRGLWGAAMHRYDADTRRFIVSSRDRPLSRPFSWGFPEWFAVAQVAGPALLYLPGTQVFRVPLRVGVFAFSLLGLVWCLRTPRATRNHPAWTLLVIAGVYMAVMLLHPATNTVMAGLAQIGMHFAIAAPLFWAPRYFWGDYRRLLRVLTILWVLNGASVVGRHPPGPRSRNLDARRVQQSWNAREYGVEYVSISSGDGTMAIRPPGLGDAPGAACGAGMFVGVIGLAFLGLPVSRIETKASVSVMGMAGIVVIFLSHVRSCSGRARRLRSRLRNHHGAAGALENHSHGVPVDGGRWRLLALLCRMHSAGKAPWTGSPRCWRTSRESVEKIRTYEHGYRCFRYAPR